MSSYVQLFLIVPLFFFLSSAANLPSFYWPCRQDDPDLAGCMEAEIARVLAAWQRAEEGVGMIPLDPLHLSNLAPVVFTGANNTHFKLYDATIAGLTDMELNEIKVDPEAKIISSEITCDVNITAKYDIDGHFGIFHVEGNGDAYLWLEKLQMALTWHWDIVRNEEGIYVFQIVKDETTTEIANAVIRLDNLLGGDPVLGKRLNEVINSLWRQFLSEETRSAFERVPKRVIEIINNFLKDIPYNEVIIGNYIGPTITETQTQPTTEKQPEPTQPAPAVDNPVHSENQADPVTESSTKPVVPDDSNVQFITTTTTTTEQPTQPSSTETLTTTTTTTTELPTQPSSTETLTATTTTTTELSTQPSSTETLTTTTTTELPAIPGFTEASTTTEKPTQTSPTEYVATESSPQPYTPAITTESAIAESTSRRFKPKIKVKLPVPTSTTDIMPTRQLIPAIVYQNITIEKTDPQRDDAEVDAIIKFLKQIPRRDKPATSSEQTEDDNYNRILKILLGKTSPLYKYNQVNLNVTYKAV